MATCTSASPKVGLNPGHHGIYRAARRGFPRRKWRPAPPFARGNGGPTARAPSGKGRALAPSGRRRLAEEKLQIAALDQMEMMEAIAKLAILPCRRQSVDRPPVLGVGPRLMPEEVADE